MSFKEKKKLVALVGRPNVGKSTLFNRLSIKDKAVVHDMPGVTRDRKYTDAKIGPLDVILIDTPGLEEAKDDAIEHRMMQQTIVAIKEADLVCLVIDNNDGVTPADKSFASLIRKYNKNCILVVNKCEKRFSHESEIYKLGFGDPVPVSAEHGLGIVDLYQAVDEVIKAQSKIQDDDSHILDHNESEDELDNPDLSDNTQSDDSLPNTNTISLVIAGRPNAGKSTFINTLLKEDRMLTGPEAGITRESVEVKFNHKGRVFKLIDTAGLRKRSNIKQSLEKLSVGSTIHSIKFANMVVLMLDATSPLEQQDLNIARYVIDQGRGLVIVVNKWDLIKDKEAYKDEFNYKLKTDLPQVKGIEAVYISSLKGKNIESVLDSCVKTFEIWNTKISTKKLNDRLIKIIDAHPLPIDRKLGRRIRIKYISQVNTRPPTFKLFCNVPEGITQSYERYLTNSLRESFGLWGVPIRFRFTKSENPYSSK